MAKSKIATNPYSPKNRVKRGKHAKVLNKRKNKKPSVGQG